MTCVYKRNPSDDGVQLVERFFYDNAGLVGAGGSSYIDSVIARPPNDDLPVDDGLGNTPTTFVLSRTLVYLQNWRGNVIGLVDQASGRLAESVRYSAYGRPFSISSASFNPSGMM